MVARIVNSIVLIKQERQDDLRKAARIIVKRVEKCIEVNGGIFEHLLRTAAIYWDHLHNQ
jgi:deferrochelatase/peroxidase EfeB